jgi:hypothetical protein
MSLISRAVHEAGHAVMSAYLRIPFSRVHINNSTKGQGGSIDTIFHPSKASQSNAHQHALVSVAGAAAERIFWPRAKDSRGDLKNIQFVYSFLKCKRSSLARLQQEADQIFQDEGLRRAIQQTSDILAENGKIDACTVKFLVNLGRPYSIARLDVEEA